MATIKLASAKGKWIMVSAILASAMAFIDSTALNVVLPAMQQSLNASGTDLFWILNAYLLMLASLILIGGSLGDKLGRKKILMTGIAIFIVGSALCGLSPGVYFLIGARVMQGCGGALMIPGSLSLISSSFNDNERGKAIGTWSAITTVVTIGGPILGGALADAGLWRFIFYINIPIGLIALYFLWKHVEESRDNETNPSIDFMGGAAIFAGLVCLTFGFLRIPETGFKHWQVLTSLAAGVVLSGIFIAIEKKSSNPMMPLQLFFNSTFSGANILSFFLYAGLGAGLLFLSLNLVQVQGYSQLQSGMTLLPFTVLLITLSRFAGSLADKYGPRWLLITGPAIAGIGLLLLSFIKQTAGPSDYWQTFFPGIVLFGFGMSITVAPLTTAVMGSVASHFSGTASGINNAVTRIASVFANAIFGALAIVFFTSSLQKNIQNITIPNQQKQLVMQQAVNLGDASVPAEVESNNRQMIDVAYKTGFIYAYSLIMKISAGLAFAGSLMAVLFIYNHKTEATN